VPFHLVVEPQEADAYADAFGEERVLVLPSAVLGPGPVPARNWLWEHSVERGFERHWCLDDNIHGMLRSVGRLRIRCPAGPALCALEDFTERYENIAVAGMHHSCFGFPERPAFSLNCHVYCCLLIRGDLSIRWRGPYNEDTDLCLQALADGWCTVTTNAFLIRKVGTMTMKGGNTDELYQGDGRLTMAKELERRWPHVVKTRRRFGRPQHWVDWTKFDTPLKLKPGIDLSKIERNEYGLRLVPRGEITSSAVKRLLASAPKGEADTGIDSDCQSVSVSTVGEA
jgi:hypothetical protein